MNGYDTTRAAEMYGTYQNFVHVVHNPIDFRMQKGVHELTDKIITDYRLSEADVIAVYPLSTTRMGAAGKQLHKAIKVMAKLKENGMSVRYIVCNAHANGDKEKKAIEEMRSLAMDYGLNPQHELIFTSLIDAPKYENGVPHEVVTQLMNFSDVFLFPSVSENCPLVLLEAALGKNLLVLNEDFSPMKDFVGPHALYFKFDSVTTVTSHPAGEDNYYNDVAKIIKAELGHNMLYRSHREIRQKFNFDYIFKNELEPLLYANWETAEEKGKVKAGSPPPQRPVVNEDV
jgi:glycosyltransferase involved in cell wall biosynthesis